MLTQQIALVSESRSVALAAVTKVAAALQKQATRDLAPIWKVAAVVGAYAKLEDVPVGYWPIMVMDDVDNAAGYHQDEDGQPFAVVGAGADWTLTASHECLEMLVDPFGRRLVAGPSPKRGQGRVQFLVEVCDPSEDATLAYRVDGVLVSDFYTPSFFDPKAAAGVRYAFGGAITAPRQVLRGGYLSWRVPASRRWWQQTWFGTRAKFVDLGVFDGAKSPREEVDRRTPEPRRKLAHLRPMRAATLLARPPDRVLQPNTWANRLRAQIRALEANRIV